MLSVGSLFSGIGGLELGLERTNGFEIKWQCEIDPYATRVLEKHWPDVKRYKDVKEIKEGNAPEQVDLICGGFPCTDISTAGKGAGIEGKQSSLWFEMLRIIRLVRPKYVLVENVSALTLRGLDRVIAGLAESGYNAEWNIVSAKDVGAPHLRKRIFIVVYTNRSRYLHRKFEKFTAERGKQTFSNPITSDSSMGNPNNTGNRTSQNGTNRDRKKKNKGREEQSFSRISGPSSEVSNTNSKGLQGWKNAGEFRSVWKNAGEFRSVWKNAEKQLTCLYNSQGNDQWEQDPADEHSESYVGRVAHGVPKRLDRLKCLGNAVVPQVAEFIGQVILNFHNGVEQ